MAAYTLFRPWGSGPAFDDLRREMDALFRHYGSGTLPGARGAFPAVNLYETGDAYVLTAELPGVRPEDIRLGAPGDQGIAGSIQLLEPVGSDLYLSIEAAGTTLLARTPPDTKVEQGENVTLTFNPGRSHVFDAEGRSVRYSVEDAPSSEPAVDDAIERVASEHS